MNDPQVKFSLNLYHKISDFFHFLQRSDFKIALKNKPKNICIHYQKFEIWHNEEFVPVYFKRVYNCGGYPKNNPGNYRKEAPIPRKVSIDFEKKVIKSVEFMLNMEIVRESIKDLKLFESIDPEI